MIKCEICSTSGQLATDKCVEFIENKDTGEKVKRRTTYLEICTEEQAPREGCSVHGGGGGGTFVKEVKPGETPRAELAVDVSKVQRVLMKAPTVLGNDPYNSSQSIKNAVAMGLLNGQVAPVDSSVNIPGVAAAPGEAGPVEPEVRRAEPVRPMQQQTAVIDTTIKLDPPPPIEF